MLDSNGVVFTLLKKICRNMNWPLLSEDRDKERLRMWTPTLQRDWWFQRLQIRPKAKTTADLT